MFTPRDHFIAFHGNSPEFFLQKDTPLIHTNGGYVEIPKDDYWYEEAKAKHNAFIDKIQSTPHEELSAQAWTDWQKGPTEAVRGNSYQKAAHILAMEKDLKERSKPIPTSLFRGSTGSPEEEIEGRGFLSATGNKKVAESFARRSRKLKGTGRISEFKAGQAHGFPLSEIPGTKKVYAGTNPEDEWIITKVGE